MKNGQKNKNLMITVANTSDGKRTVDVMNKSSEKSDIRPGGERTDPNLPEASSRDPGHPSSPPQDDVKAAKDSGLDPNHEDSPEQGERKKKKRQRDRKKKRVKQEQAQNQDSRPSSQASNVSSGKVKEKAEVQGSPADANRQKPISEAAKPDPKKPEQEKILLKKRSPLSIYANPLLEGEDKPTEAKKPEEKSPSSVQEEAAKKLEELGLKQAEKRLEKDFIFKLEKKSPTFPEALYFCQLCSHHLNTIQLAHKHIKDKRHKKEFKAKEQDELLKRLKTPPEAAVAALERLLLSVIKENMMSEKDAEARRDVVKKLGELVSKELPGCSLVMYGSSASLIALWSSDVNIDIQFPGTMKTPTVLLSMLALLKNSDDYVDVKEDFDAKVPRIEITDKQTKIRCSLSTNNIKSLHTSRLLRVYSKLEPTVIKLAMLLRYWGRLCQVDRQSEGSLPPHSFALMAVYYLQQRHKLPVLHETMAPHDLESILEDDSDLHEQLQQKEDGWWYYPTMPPSDKKQEAEDEEDVDETAEFSDSDDDLEITFTESAEQCESSAGPKHVEEVSLDPVQLSECFDGRKPLLAELWLDVLKYYSVQFDMENLVIAVRSSSRVTRSDRGWSHRRIAIEDPCSPKWNLCKPMNSQALFSYFMMRLKHCVFYFHTAHHSLKKKREKVPEKQKNSPKKVPDSSEKKNQISALKNGKIKTADQLASVILRSALEEVKVHMSCLSKPENGKLKLHSPEAIPVTSDPISDFAEDLSNDVIRSFGVMSLKDETEEKSEKGTNSKAETSAESFGAGETSPLEPNYDVCYKFTKNSLTDGKVPVTVCCLCKKEGHSKKSCPDEVKVKVEPLPPLTKRLRTMLDAVCKEMYDTYVPKEEEVELRERVCSDLLEYLRQNYSKNVKLCLFGSSRNRFTFRGSDLDICMTFNGNETGEGLDFVNIIEDLAKVLRRDPALRHIIPITTAKVPIVKFFHPKTALEGDISLYNLLAQRNTSMLALYATIDVRCRILGYAMKAFVKRCCIGDASRGSLSSYAYTLLVIYFLQQRDPPVLPVLQEMYKEDQSPEYIVDGWNSWFYDCIGDLQNAWEDYGKNKESVGELWLGLLRFYTEEFNFRQHVASIRQKKILTAFEKEWTSKCICIEDPFDLNHNLGAGVSRKMTNFIMSVFIKARERFGTEPPHNGLMDYQRYFFDAHVLMDGQEVPNDRCCRICGKIGHFVKDCPKRRNGRNKNKNGDMADAKLRELECFACGKKGHFRKDCPEAKKVHGSPVRNNGFFLESPRGGPIPVPLLPTPIYPPYVTPAGAQMLMHQVTPPVVVRAKMQDQGNMNFPDMRPEKQNYQSPAGKKQQKPLESRDKKQQKTTQPNWKYNPRNEQSPSSGHTTGDNSRTNRLPQSNHTRQQKQSVNQETNPKSSPFPSGTSQHQQAMPAAPPKSSPVSRNLTVDFDLSKNLIAERKLTGPVKRAAPTYHPSPTTSDLPPSRSSRHGLTLKDTNAAVSDKFKNGVTSLTAMPTVTEVESQLLARSPKEGGVMPQPHQQGQLSPTSARPQAGDKINHLIPRQQSKEDLGPGLNGVHPNQPNLQSPQYQQFLMSPLSPTNLQMYGGPFVHPPQYSTSPGRQGQFPDSSEVPYFRSASMGPMVRTPPVTHQVYPHLGRSPNSQFYMGGVSRPGVFGSSYPPGAIQQQQRFEGHFQGRGPDPTNPPTMTGPIMSEVFVNSKDESHGFHSPREGQYNSPIGPQFLPQPYDRYGANSLHHSYPPKKTPPSNNPPKGAAHWNTPSRK